jgi:hypothetical protein
MKKVTTHGRPQKTQYVISCYGPGTSLFSAPLRASTSWLQRVLGRDEVINAEPLSQTEFTLLKSRLDWRIEITWCPGFQYFVESVSKTQI